jgi:sugar/nucleoside kinase (ribokinase family)
MTEDEFDLLGASGDPWQLAAGALGPDLKLITVTLGARGAAYVTSGDLPASPLEWRTAAGVAVAGRAQSGMVALEEAPRSGDPTGCGDVWGATAFARLLGGDGLDAAMRAANRAASRNVEHRGARGLYRHLAGRLSHVEGGS